MKLHFDKIGVVGILLTAIVSPCCFPLFTFGLSMFGFGSFELFGGWTMWIFQGFVLLSFVGTIFSYRKSKIVAQLILSSFSTALIFYSYYFDSSDDWQMILYIGVFGLFITSILDYYISRKKRLDCSSCTVTDTKMLNSTITCPNCGYKKEEVMPTDACVYFYTCDNCNIRLKPKQGDCCVYCSYGTVKCPSIQAINNCC